MTRERFALAMTIMKDREKITYTVDPHNRLVAKKTGKASGVKGHRQVLDGRFKIGKDNSLTYHVKKSSRTDTPQQVKLSGRYSLERDRDLVLTLNKWSNQVEGNKLIIKGQLLDAKEDEVSFIVGTRDSSKNACNKEDDALWRMEDEQKDRAVL